MATDWPCSALKNLNMDFFRERGLDGSPDRARALILLRISLRFQRKRRFRFFRNKCFKNQKYKKHVFDVFLWARGWPGAGPGPARRLGQERGEYDHLNRNGASGEYANVHGDALDQQPGDDNSRVINGNQAVPRHINF